MIKPEITAEKLDRLDVRVGTILAVEDVPGSASATVGARSLRV